MGARLARWWDLLLVRFALGTGFAPTAANLIATAAIGLVAVAMLVAAMVWSGRAAPDTEARARGFGAGWHCTDIPNAESICFRDPPAPAKP